MQDSVCGTPVQHVAGHRLYNFYDVAISLDTLACMLQVTYQSYGMPAGRLCYEIRIYTYHTLTSPILFAPSSSVVSIAGIHLYSVTLSRRPAVTLAQSLNAGFTDF